MKTMTNQEVIEFCVNNNIRTDFYKFRSYNNYILVCHYTNRNIFFEHHELEEITIVDAIQKGYKFFFIDEKDISDRSSTKDILIIKDKFRLIPLTEHNKPMFYGFADIGEHNEFYKKALVLPSLVRKNPDMWCTLMKTKKKGVYLNVSSNPWIPSKYTEYLMDAEDMAQSNFKKFIFAKRADIENPFFKIESYSDPYESDKKIDTIYEYCRIRKGAKVKHICSEK